ncbi:hypothetical protein OQA88_10343 [Cercophora sp. LCS_1]
MAPTGPRGGGGTRTVPPRGPRRGGISKNRGPVRTDRDGDISMDAPGGAAGPTRGGRGGVRGGRGSRDGQARGSRQSSRIAQNINNYAERGALKEGSKAHFRQPRTTMKVTHLGQSKASNNADGGKKSLVDFIERKVKGKAVRIGKRFMVGDTLWISVHPDDVKEISQLDGYTHAGAPLSIVTTEEPMPEGDSSIISQEAVATKEKLDAVLSTRYFPEQRLLNLSALGADETLSQMGTFNSQSVAEKAFKALLVIASAKYKNAAEKQEAIQAVSIASNDIEDVQQVFTLAHSLPGLKRLDLSNNKLDSLPKIAKWQGRFKHLEELHLTGNPIMQQADYVPELLKWFPSLQNLNGQQVRTPEEAAAALRALEPIPFPQYPSNIRDGENNIASEFLSCFFTMYDDDRGRLAAEFYDQDSWFSLSVIPNSGRTHNFKAYMKYSRDIQSLGPRTSGVVQRLFTGGSLIADLWKALPATRHPSVTETNRWIVDCHTFPHLADPTGQGFAMGLFISVHGQFEEADPANGLFGTRTFSRVFVLAPSKPMPPPPHPYRVISDQLTLHDWVPSPKPTETPASVVPAPIPATVEPAPVLPDDVMKAQLIQEISKRTGMTAEYSEMCLTGLANWDFEMALQVFEEKKALLPANAFISGGV